MKIDDFMELLFPEVLVKKIEIKEITPCTADPEKIKFLAHADKPLEDVLPILYLAIPNAKYSEKLGALSYRYKQHLITMFSTGRIGMTYVKDRSEAEQLIEEAKNLINHAFVYLKIHGKPEPKLIKAKKELDPTKIYEKLPKTNCKECGEQGCFAFAAKLLNGEKSLHDCSPLSLEENVAIRIQIEKMMSPIKLK
ncbi:MAG: (Fe-S)-binding protein [Candidatus Bathyarchaeota archaeon]|jgi:ArsR family metal-binding transcriptional regulator|nr:Fe-S protein [Candidatus Bathyarchaeota archaeon A05DMB-5]MDH7557971.1 (Fe-S)-binding protein [Candidatus Bathyarchaeota archaeon]